MSIKIIQVFYRDYDGYLFGFIFYSGKKEIARIGNTTNYPTTTIKLKKGEVWCGFSTSNEKNDG